MMQVPERRGWLVRRYNRAPANNRVITIRCGPICARTPSLPCSCKDEWDATWSRTGRAMDRLALDRMQPRHRTCSSMVTSSAL